MNSAHGVRVKVALPVAASEFTNTVYVPVCGSVSLLSDAVAPQGQLEASVVPSGFTMLKRIV
jgi:hypothetical protein